MKPVGDMATTFPFLLWRALTSLAMLGRQKIPSTQARPSDELPVSAFCNAHNCLNSPYAFEANEELAKVCLLRKGLGLVLGVCATEESHRNSQNTLILLFRLMKNKQSLLMKNRSWTSTRMVRFNG